MLYIQRYRSPLGEILMAADAAGLVGLWFAGQKHFAPGLTQAREQETPVLAAAGRWLDLYFAGRRPHFIPPLHLTGTEFRMAVWSLLQEIPYGEVTTYSELARQLAQRLEGQGMLCSSMKSFISCWVKASMGLGSSTLSCWHQSSMSLSARKRSLHSRQSIRGSEKPARWPLATQVWGFMRMAASRPTL